MTKRQQIKMYLKFRNELDKICVPVILSELHMQIYDIKYNNKVVGMMCANPDYIDCVYIQPEYRRKGLAKKQVLNFVKEHIRYGVRLHIINNNEPAKAFWNNLFDLKVVGGNQLDTLYEIVRIKEGM